MPRISLADPIAADPIAADLGELLAAAANRRRPPAYASIGLAVYVDQFVNYGETPLDVPARTRAA